MRRPSKVSVNGRPSHERYDLRSYIKEQSRRPRQRMEYFVERTCPGKVNERLDGPFSSKAKADAVCERLRKQGVVAHIASYGSGP